MTGKCIFLNRFVKKKEDKGKEQKTKHKSDVLNEEELERMKEERDRYDICARIHKIIWKMLANCKQQFGLGHLI